jgi:hypothetical protein
MGLCLNETLLTKRVSGPDLALWVAGCTDPQRNPWSERNKHLKTCYLYWVLVYEKTSLPNKCQNTPYILTVRHLDTMLLLYKFVKSAFNLLKLRGQQLLSEFMHTYSNKIKLQ